MWYQQSTEYIIKDINKISNTPLDEKQSQLLRTTAQDLDQDASVRWDQLIDHLFD